MKNVLITLGVVVGVIVLLVMIAVSIRNGLIDKDEQVNAAWSQIDTQLQRRADLIPNLVNTVKGYAKHEENIFREVSEARSKLVSAQGPVQKAEAGAVLEQSIGRLLAIAEKYPDLKANTNFIRLQDELAGTENRISVARMRYNETVREFNASIRKFPGSLFVGGLGLKPAEYFQPPAGSKAVAEVPEVSF